VVTAVEPLTDVSLWARSSGLEILLILTGAALLTRFASWLGAKITTRIDDNAQESDALVRSEAAKHRHALVQVITWTALVIIYCVAAVLIVARLGVPISSLVAPATVAGVALGFGAQRIVQDILAGFFVITERQYGFGDVIRLTIPGTGEPIQGTVVDVSLRVTQMRTANGEVVITPNGQIVQATNLSRDWARAVVDVPVPSTADIGRVTAILQHVGIEAYADEDLRTLLLDEPSVMGVESIQVDQLNIRVVARTLPGKQFDVGRRLRTLIAEALRKEGIVVAPMLDTETPSGQA
jgi:moderate conductance mechanosensitive channel